MTCQLKIYNQITPCGYFWLDLLLDSFFCPHCPGRVSLGEAQEKARGRNKQGHLWVFWRAGLHSMEERVAQTVKDKTQTQTWMDWSS